MNYSELESAIENNDKELVIKLLLTNISLSTWEMRVCKTPEMLRLLLETGIDVNQPLIIQAKLINGSCAQNYWFFTLIMDYGAQLSSINPHGRSQHEKDYISLVKHRITASRKSLCALLWCCRRGFIPLRGIILELTRAAWAQRGGEGCGARGYVWKKELEENYLK